METQCEFQSALRFAVLPDLAAIAVTAGHRRDDVSIRFKVRGASRHAYVARACVEGEFQSALRFAVLPAKLAKGWKPSASFNPL